ncbi:uncharacterized protein I206_105263 [Kwoniella pini CBS 10737]|uniref:NAD-dependent epimerase/dehydratase domain-containing protein n=1 Tax=Kwoniella pini CBS 10737 TaxID=1296096 RepID=A0A1B9I4R7_9TREE|nr:uncharacterized protein I206_03828 [Kwoniella pini CBS 10737]OCF50504.1 hypothetical protein I206_03828 [Kwoniella pini CBS 10737]
MKVFITGASGWVGRHVVPELQSHGHEITALARSDSSADALEKQGVKVIRGGLEDTDILHSAAKESDAVIHLAYIHDFSDYGGKPAQIDFEAIKAMASALEGTNKIFVGTSGALGLQGEQTEKDSSAGGPRKIGEEITFSFKEKGVKTIVIRLAPSIHGKGDKGFIPILINFSKKSGYSAFIENKPINWKGCHVKDASILYRLSIENEKIPNGSILHGISDEIGIPFSEIAKSIGNNLSLEIKAFNSIKDEDEIKKHFDWMAMILNYDCNAKNQITKEITGWIPKEKGLLEDINTGSYFQ